MSWILMGLLAGALAAQDHAQIQNIFHGAVKHIPVLSLQEKTSDEKIQQWLKDLGDDDAQKREEATFNLIENFKQAEGSLRKLAQKTKDAEIQGRLSQILKEGPMDSRIRALKRKLSAESLRHNPRIADMVYSDDPAELYNMLVAAFSDKSEILWRISYLDTDTPVLRKALVESIVLDNPERLNKIKGYDNSNTYFWMILNKAVEKNEVDGKKLIPFLRSEIQNQKSHDRSKAFNALIKSQSPEENIKYAEAFLRNETDKTNPFLISLSVHAFREAKSTRHAPVVREILKGPNPNWWIHFECRMYFITLFPKEEESIKIALEMFKERDATLSMNEGLNAIERWGLASKYRKEIEKVAEDEYMYVEARWNAQQILNRLNEKK